MPTVNFYAFDRTSEQKDALKARFLEILTDYYDEGDVISMAILNLAPTNIAHGGALVFDGGVKTIPADKPWLIAEY